MLTNIRSGTDTRRWHPQLYEWALVISLALMFGFVGLNRSGIGYMLPPLVQEFQLEFWQAGLLVSGTSTAWAISAWLSGSISDRLGRKKVMLFGLYAASAISALFGLSWSFLSLFVFRDLLGLGDGVANTTGQSTIAERTNPNRRALYQGIFNCGFGVIGLGLGAFIVTHLTTALGWRWVFPIIGVVGALITTALAVIMPADLPAGARAAAGQLKPSAVMRDVREILAAHGMPFVIVGSTLTIAWFGLNIAFASLFLTRIRGYSLNEAGDILSVASLIGSSGTVLIPAFSDVIGRRTTAIVAAVGAGTCFLIFPLLPMPTPALILTLTLGSICVSGVQPLTAATLPSELVPRRRGAAIGVATLFASGIGITLSPVIGGVLADQLGLVVPLVLAALCLLGIAPAMLGVPETAPRVLARRQIAGGEAVHA